MKAILLALAISLCGISSIAHAGVIISAVPVKCTLDLDVSEPSFPALDCHHCDAGTSLLPSSLSVSVSGAVGMFSVRFLKPTPQLGVPIFGTSILFPPTPLLDGPIKPPQAVTICSVLF